MSEVSDSNQAAGGGIDLVGAGLSFLCLAHCAILPFLPLVLAGLPWLENEAIHLGLLALITPISLFAFVRGVKRHGKKPLLILGCAAVVILLLGPVAGHDFEKPLTVVGSIMLCVGHWFNRK